MATSPPPPPSRRTTRVRVTEWRFAPSEATGWHKHAMDYVVAPMTPGRLLLEQPDGTSRHAASTAGVSYAKPAGVEHDVVNDGGGEFVFVEIELKHRPSLRPLGTSRAWHEAAPESHA